jgi:TonB family protein
MNTIKFIKFLGLTFASALLILACSGDNGKGNGGGSKLNSKKANDPSVTVWLLSEPESINPITSTSSHALNLINLMFSRLLEYDPKTLKLVPQSAVNRPEIKEIIEKLPDEKKSPEGSPDGKGDDKNKSTGTHIKLPDFEIEDKRKKEVEIEMALTFAEKMPRYCGCEEAGQKEEEKRICSDRKMTAFLAKVVDYPLMAREMGYEGKVFISFTVEKDGSISSIEIKKDMTPGGGLANAAKKAVEKMAKESCWQAAEQKGRKVRLRLTVPVQFNIRTK